jgi:transcriptional regulator with XRE-family HTH domain
MVSIMPGRSSQPQPIVARLLAALGENIRLARLRRKLPASLLAERAGMSRPTLRAVERGDPKVTLGSVANVLHSLGLEKELGAVASQDELGHLLQDAELPRQRAPNRKQPAPEEARQEPRITHFAAWKADLLIRVPGGMA